MAAEPAILGTAHAAGLVGCRECGRVRPLGTPLCPRCGSALHPPSPASLQRVWAWLAAGVVFYIPANLYPMLLTTIFGHTTRNTILGGAIDLARHGALWVALVVFVASIIIPITKFVVIAWLALQVRDPGALSADFAVRRTRLYHIVDFIGRWSMIDVFVVAILAALVQMQFVAAINPGIAAISFCVSVILTMLAAQAFDSRLIWMATAAPDTATGPAALPEPAP